MALELTEDFIKDNELTEAQVTAVTGHANTWHDTELSTAKKDWDGKANTDAEAIINGMISHTQKVNNFTLDREDAEKHGDYMARYNKELLKTERSGIDALKLDYETKLKDFKGDEATATELQKAKDDLDLAQQKYADYDTLKEQAGLVDGLSGENASLTKLVTYGSVKPNFPDTVNPYEAKAVWNEFMTETEKDWDVKLVENVPTAINKENKHKTEKLSDLLAKNEAITTLMAGRQQKGTGSREKNLRDIEGVPFAVPTNADTKDHVVLVKEQIAKEGIGVLDKNYSLRFKELIELVQQKTAS